MGQEIHARSSDLLTSQVGPHEEEQQEETSSNPAASSPADPVGAAISFHLALPRVLYAFTQTDL